MKRAALFFLILFLFVSASGASLYYWSYRTFHSPGKSGQAVRMVVPRGASLNRIAELLHEARAIDMPRVFVLAARLSGEGRAIKAGEYEFAPGASQLAQRARIAHCRIAAAPGQGTRAALRRRMHLQCAPAGYTEQRMA